MSGRTRAQKHQNSYAFTHNKGSKKTEKILSLPIAGVCQHCREVIEWRKQYRKYKPLTAPKKCVQCSQKTVKHAYHVICDSCSHTKRVCAKCLQPRDILPPSLKTPEELFREEQKEKEMLEKMRERERRTYLRRKEQGLPPREFTGGSDDDSDFDDSDLDDSDFDDEMKPNRQSNKKVEDDDEEDDEDDDDEDDDEDDEDEEEENTKGVKNLQIQDKNKAQLNGKQTQAQPQPTKQVKKPVQKEEEEDSEEEDDEEEQKAATKKPIVRKRVVAGLRRLPKK